MKHPLNYIITCLFLIVSFVSSAQVKGKITDQAGEPLPFVSIYIENTYIGTTSNEKGFYELNVQNQEQVKLVFQYLGYKTQKHVLNLTKLPLNFDVSL